MKGVIQPTFGGIPPDVILSSSRIENDDNIHVFYHHNFTIHNCVWYADPTPMKKTLIFWQLMKWFQNLSQSFNTTLHGTDKEAWQLAAALFIEPFNTID